jgi:hypothetical protein
LLPCPENSILILSAFILLQDDPAIVESSVNMTGKHFINTTLIQMDKNGDYQLVHGPKLRKIKADNIKILFSASV